jgi:hypothetical protein
MNYQKCFKLKEILITSSVAEFFDDFVPGFLILQVRMLLAVGDLQNLGNLSERAKKQPARVIQRLRKQYLFWGKQ